MAQETAWRLLGHVQRYGRSRIQAERYDRAVQRQWGWRRWLMSRVRTNSTGVETVEGCESASWDTELDAYLSTDTHSGAGSARDSNSPDEPDEGAFSPLSDSGEGAPFPAPPSTLAPAPCPRGSSNSSVFIGDGDSDYPSGGSSDAAPGATGPDPTTAQTGPSHTTLLHDEPVEPNFDAPTPNTAAASDLCMADDAPVLPTAPHGDPPPPRAFPLLPDDTDGATAPPTRHRGLPAARRHYIASPTERT